MPYKYWPHALRCFCLLYSFAHVDARKGTVSHVERHAHKFSGKEIPFGSKIRYLPSAEREVEKREKLQASLRTGIFVGYRMHTGGKWTSQYMVVDSEAYGEIQEGSGNTVYVHAISEIYLPGSSGDDTQTFPTFPVADGTFTEKKVTHIADVHTVAENDSLEDLVTSYDETLPSSEREGIPEDLDPANAGGVGARASDDDDTERGDSTSANQDVWSIEGDYLVRRHRMPRTAVFSPSDVPEDPPPIDAKHLEVLRQTKPRFSGQQWPEMELVEDCWTGHASSDAKSLLNPVDGSPLTWTGETIFERVLPAPPRSKIWCGGELVRAKTGSKRAPDVHPLHWWLMSTTARLKASDQWKVKYKEITQAQSRRTLPREELAEMPKSSIQLEYPQRQETALTALFLVNQSTAHDDERPPPLVCLTGGCAPTLSCSPCSR